MTLNCPNCSSPMTEMHRHGVHLDYCQTCKGVWLDRGEIDRILGTAGVAVPPASGAPESGEHVLGPPEQDQEFLRVLRELRKEGRLS